MRACRSLQKIALLLASLASFVACTSPPRGNPGEGGHVDAGGAHAAGAPDGAGSGAVSNGGSEAREAGGDDSELGGSAGNGHQGVGGSGPSSGGASDTAGTGGVTSDGAVCIPRDSGCDTNADCGEVLPGCENVCVPSRASSQGNVVTGSVDSCFGPYGSFIWDRPHGMRDFAQLLVNAGMDLSGWESLAIADVSDDGRVFVGVGMYLSSKSLAFRATLPAAAFE
jgi:hypothetical protein